MHPHDEHDCAIDGETIRSVRIHWGMPRWEFARWMRVCPGTIYTWERYGITCRSHKFDYESFRALKLSRDSLGDDQGTP